MPSQTPQLASALTSNLPLAGPAGAQHRLTMQQCLYVSLSLAGVILCRILDMIHVASPCADCHACCFAVPWLETWECSYRMA